MKKTFIISLAILLIFSVSNSISAETVQDAKPDLIVTNFSLTPENLYLNDTGPGDVIINVSVKNIGNGVINAPSGFFLGLYCISSNCPSPYYNVFSSGAITLTPNGTKDFKFTWNEFAVTISKILSKSGDFILAMKADSTNIYDELNEDNNAFQKNIKIIDKSQSSSPVNKSTTTPVTENLEPNIEPIDIIMNADRLLVVKIKNTGGGDDFRVRWIHAEDIETHDKFAGMIMPLPEKNETANIKLESNTYFKDYLLHVPKKTSGTFKFRVTIDNNSFEKTVVENSSYRCIDSDAGKDYFTKGYTTDTESGKKNEDKCIVLNGKPMIEESYCSDDDYAYLFREECAFGCNDGACRAQAENSASNAIGNNAILLLDNDLQSILDRLKKPRDLNRELTNQNRYLKSLKDGAGAMSEKKINAVTIFITYGVDDNTSKLGDGERAAVMNSYKIAFKKLPNTEEEMVDLIKIANGLWPNTKSSVAEKAANEHFQKIYKRIADMDNSSDNAAITVMAYGLRQKAENRNLNSEKRGINTFKSIYGHMPSSTEDWNIMQAITYSGASRGLDSDGDLLTDIREEKLGTDPNKKDSDGDGYIDGVEVANGYNPLK